MAPRSCRRAGLAFSLVVVFFLLVLCAPTAPGVLAATDPGLAGPFATGTQNVDIPVRGGATRNADVYYPAAGGGVDPEAGFCPVVVFGHGFSRNKDRYTDFGTHLASRGYVVVIANYVCGILSGCNHSGNADEMTDVTSWIVARNSDPSSIFFGRLDTARVATSGHSAGGLQGLVAASRDPRVGASAPMDPVDSNGLGVSSLPGTRIPIAITYAEPSSCNANGSAVDLYAAANPQKRGVKLVGANHCDPEKNNDLIGCALTCGSWNATRHQRYLRYVTGWFEYYLHCDASYKEWVFGARVSSDLGAGLVAYDALAHPPPPAGVAASWDGSAVRVQREPPSQCGGIDFWRVYRSSSLAGPYVLVADSLPISETLWTDWTAAAGSTYHYVARDAFSDFRSAFESADSNVASITTSLTTPREASGPGLPMTASRGPGTSLDVQYSPAPCATDHVAYWGSAAGPLAPPLSWSGQACGLGATGQATFDPGDPAPGSWLHFVVVGNDGAAEGSYGRGSGDAERPEASGLPGCDYPQRLDGSCP